MLPDWIFKLVALGPPVENSTFFHVLLCNNIVSSLFQCRFPAVVTEGMALPQRILFPPEKIYMDWQQQWRAGAGLHNPGNLCFLNSVLQCLTYTPPLANYLLSREHSRSCEYFQERLHVNLSGASRGFQEPGI